MIETPEPILDHANPVFGLELRGFDHIPAAERNMRLSEVGPLWLGANLNMFNISLGCVSVALGLSLWQALLACAIGNLPYVYLGLASVGSVRAGLPVTTFSRAVYGVRGNRLHAFLVWLCSVCFEVFNTVFGVFAWLSLIGLLGFDRNGLGEKLGAVVIQLIVGGGIAVLGHATMVWLQRLFAAVLGVVLLAAVAWTAPQGHWMAAGHGHLAGWALMAALITGAGVVASQPVSYLYNGPDWVRYLPVDTRGLRIFRRVFWWNFLSSFALSAAGALWASLGDMSDPVGGMKPFLPPWLYIAFILAVIAGSVANNAPTFYSSGLALQAVGLRLSRWAATLLDIGVSSLAVLYILFVQDLSTMLNDFVSLLVVWSGPYAGVWLADGLKRRWRFDLAEIHPPAETTSPKGGWRWRAWAGFAAGAGAAALTMKSPLYQGPISHALGGMDLSWVVGPLTAAGVYALLSAASRTPVAAREGAEA